MIPWVLSAARKADESAAGHIIMSVKENVSYETLEAETGGRQN